MKNYISVFSMFIMGAFCVFPSVFCMELNADNYPAGCRKIDEKYKSKFNKMVLGVTDENALDTIKHSKHALKVHKRSVVNQKEIAFFAFQKKHSIDDKQWTLCIRAMHILQEWKEESMWSPCGGVIHDTTIPQGFLSMLKKELLNVGFNPQRTHIISNKDSCFWVEGVDCEWSCKSGVLTAPLREETIPGTIKVNCQQFNEELKNGCVDRVQGKCMILAEVMKLYPALDILPVAEAVGVKIKKKEPIAWCSLRYLLAILSVALKNKRSAHCVKEYLYNFKLSYFSVENYKQIASIAFHWKVLAWLKKYFDNNYHCIPLLLKVRDSDVNAVMECLDKGMVVTQKTITVARHKNKDEVSIKEVLQVAYDDQKCCICMEHPEDMRDIPCTCKHVKDFMCRQCYNAIDHGQNKKHCPICRFDLGSYSQPSVLYKY